MKLFEFEGKKLFKRYGIAVPKGTVITARKKTFTIKPPCVVKAQVLSGQRKKHGGIILARTKAEATQAVKKLMRETLGRYTVERVLIEEHIQAHAEYYIGISYDTYTRGPVLSLSPCGGSDVENARTTPIDILQGLPTPFLEHALREAKFPAKDIVGVLDIIQKLWKLFISEYALLAEINPLFKTAEGAFVAGDAKIILDDEKVCPGERRFIDMKGDIAILASGGGASLLNIDALLHYKGQPANYTEYSGNPPAHIVKDLTKRVLSAKGLKGCWVVGGTANFTDIYETMLGFVEGLQAVKPRPKFPIVIRRDGPRQQEAFGMLRYVAKKEGYDFHLYNSQTPMSETARIMVELAYRKHELRIRN